MHCEAQRTFVSSSLCLVWKQCPAQQNTCSDIEMQSVNLSQTISLASFLNSSSVFYYMLMQYYVTTFRTLNYCVCYVSFIVALVQNGLQCADVSLRNYSLTDLSTLYCKVFSI